MRAILLFAAAVMLVGCARSVAAPVVGEPRPVARRIDAEPNVATTPVAAHPPAGELGAAPGPAAGGEPAGAADVAPGPAAGVPAGAADVAPEEIEAQMPGSEVPPEPALATPPSPPKAPAAAVPPTLSPEVGDEEAQRLRGAAETRIERTERILSQINERQLSGQQREMLSAVLSFLEKAKDALLAREFSRAATLTEKAEVLALELSPRGTR